jgi:glycerol dehydrogenase-like iron-containing ADH family enzyme
MSIGEVRKVAYIINENSFLKEENKVLDSLVLYSSKTIDLLQTNLELNKTESIILKGMFDDCMKIDVIRQKEIEAIQQQCKKEKRILVLKAGGGGLVAGMILMLIIL